MVGFTYYVLANIFYICIYIFPLIFDVCTGEKVTTYKITVHTGDFQAAGTNAYVYVTLYGQNGESEETFLGNEEDNFERGQVDEFYIKIPSLGRLEWLNVEQDRYGMFPGWFLDKIIVEDMDTGTVYEFPCHRWLSASNEDGFTSRELRVNRVITEKPPVSMTTTAAASKTTPKETPVVSQKIIKGEKSVAGLYNPKLKATPDRKERSKGREECIRLCLSIPNCQAVNFFDPDEYCAMYWDLLNAEKLGAYSEKGWSVWVVRSHAGEL